jgi:uncharacterized membrane protein
VNLTDTLLGEGWYWAAWLLWLPLFANAVRRAPWRRLQDSDQLNVWLGMVVLLTLIWSMKAGIKPGLALHLVGATVFTLSFGPHLAFIGLSLVMAGITVNGVGGVFSYGANALLTAGVGVLCSQFFYRVVAQALPRHFFVYIFVNCFFGAAVSLAGIALVSLSFLGLAGAYDWEYLFGEYLPYFLLLGFSEAWLSGMVMTLFVVYRPHWVATFDDSRYLNDK